MGFCAHDTAATYG